MTLEECLAGIAEYEAKRKERRQASAKRRYALQRPKMAMQLGRKRRLGIGDKVNCWTITGFARGTSGYVAQCDCGSVGTIRLGATSQSCGCQRSALLKTSYANKRSIGIHHPSRKHGRSQTREYQSYKHMVDRCGNPESDSFYLYGGRGITVATTWLGDSGFTTFLQDMGLRPGNTSLDRIDPDKGYYPENCRWADPKTQIQNRRTLALVSVARLRKLEAFAASMGASL